MNKLSQSKSIIITIVICIVVCIASNVATSIIFYNKGYNDNAPIASDGSPVVYVTPSGDRYHQKRCDYINDHNSISISKEEAIKKGYTACSHCKPK